MGLSNYTTQPYPNNALSSDSRTDRVRIGVGVVGNNQQTTPLTEHQAVRLKYHFVPLIFVWIEINTISFILLCILICLLNDPKPHKFVFRSSLNNSYKSNKAFVSVFLCVLLCDPFLITFIRTLSTNWQVFEANSQTETLSESYDNGNDIDQ